MDDRSIAMCSRPRLDGETDPREQDLPHLRWTFFHTSGISRWLTAEQLRLRNERTPPNGWFVDSFGKGPSGETPMPEADARELEELSAQLDMARINPESLWEEEEGES